MTSYNLVPLNVKLPLTWDAVEWLGNRYQCSNCEGEKVYYYSSTIDRMGIHVLTCVSCRICGSVIAGLTGKQMKELW